MGLFQSCLAKNNELRVVPVVKEEMEAYEKVIRALVTEDMTEKRAGVAFDLTFISEKTPKMPSPKMLKNKKEDFEKWKGRYKILFHDNTEVDKNRHDNTEGFIFSHICLIRILESQKKTLAEKQKMAQQIRDEARVQREIEVAHKEVKRLQKYVSNGAE